MNGKWSVKLKVIDKKARENRKKSILIDCDVVVSTDYLETLFSVMANSLKQIKKEDNYK